MKETPPNAAPEMLELLLSYSPVPSGIAARLRDRQKFSQLPPWQQDGVALFYFMIGMAGFGAGTLLGLVLRSIG